MPVTRAQNRSYALAEGLRRMADVTNLWALLMRYQAQAERHYRRAVEEFERLRKLPPNEPTSVTQPKQNEELATLEELNAIAPRDFQYHPQPSRAQRDQSPSPVPCPPSPESQPPGPAS